MWGGRDQCALGQCDVVSRKCLRRSGMGDAAGHNELKLYDEAGSVVGGEGLLDIHKTRSVVHFV